MDIRSLKAVNSKLNSIKSDLENSVSSLRPSSIDKLKHELDSISDTLDSIYELIGVDIQTDDDRIDQILFGVNALLKSNASGGSFAALVDAEVEVADELPGTEDCAESDNKSTVMREYSSCIRDLPDNCSEYVEAEKCADLIKLWFNKRFYGGVRIETGYKLDRLHEWIENIVIEYSIHIRDGTVKEFESNFRLWCNNISDSGNKYIVPSSIFKHSKQLDPSAASLTGLVLWEILMNSGLSALSVMPLKQFGLRPNALYNRFTDIDYSDKLIDQYVSYKLDESVLNLAKIHRKGTEK